MMADFRNVFRGLISIGAIIKSLFRGDESLNLVAICVFVLRLAAEREKDSFSCFLTIVEQHKTKLLRFFDPPLWALTMIWRDRISLKFRISK